MMGEINWDLVEEYMEDAHPDTKARFIALIKNMGGQPLTDEEKAHLADMRKIHGVREIDD